MSDQNELLLVCADLIRLIEGVGCKDWRDQYGHRIKDTNEWARAYVAINNAIADYRKAKVAQPPCGAAGAVPTGYVVVKESELLRVARMAEDLKLPCGEWQESRQAIRNGQYMDVSYAIRTLLASRPYEPVAQAEGFVLVPVEPTEAMVTVGADVVYDGNDQRHREVARFAYKRMIAAAQGDAKGAG